MLPPELERLLPSTSTETTAIGGSGSNRRYWRLHFDGHEDLIATSGTNRAENEAFFYLDKKLEEAGVNVPHITGISCDRMTYLQTDAGSKSLFECLDRTDLIAKAIKLLAQAQSVEGIDYSRCFPIAEMNRRAIMWDLNYFKYCFLKTCPGLEIDEPRLEDEFERIADRALSATPRGLMLRDFQSRNVMVKGDDVFLIDFQGARLGPAHYDVASFLWQARANFSAELRDEMISLYCATRGIDEEKFREEIPYFVALRLLQALGAYGFRGRMERKEHFLLSIPPALKSLSSELSQLSDLPYIGQLSDQLQHD